MRRVIVTAALLLLVPALLAACGGDDPGLTRAEVEEIVREEVAEATSNDDLPDQTQSVNDDTAACKKDKEHLRCSLE